MWKRQQSKIEVPGPWFEKIQDKKYKEKSEDLFHSKILPGRPSRVHRPIAGACGLRRYSGSSFTEFSNDFLSAVMVSGPWLLVFSSYLKGFIYETVCLISTLAALSYNLHKHWISAFFAASTFSMCTVPVALCCSSSGFLLTPSLQAILTTPNRPKHFQVKLRAVQCSNRTLWSISNLGPWLPTLPRNRDPKAALSAPPAPFGKRASSAAHKMRHHATAFGTQPGFTTQRFWLEKSTRQSLQRTDQPIIRLSAEPLEELQTCHLSIILSQGLASFRHKSQWKKSTISTPLHPYPGRFSSEIWQFLRRLAVSQPPQCLWKSQEGWDCLRTIFWPTSTSSSSPSSMHAFSAFGRAVVWFRLIQTRVHIIFIYVPLLAPQFLQPSFAFQLCSTLVSKWAKQKGRDQMKTSRAQQTLREAKVRPKDPTSDSSPSDSDELSDESDLKSPACNHMLLLGTSQV